MGQRMMLFRTFHELVLPSYLLTVIRSHNFQAQYLDKQVGGGVQHLRVGDVESLALPVPPIAEQHQIVAEIAARTIAIDNLGAELERRSVRSDRLRQSTLASAFSGELIPQDPSDEPAKALLRRIQTRKINMPQKKTPRKNVAKKRATAVRNKDELVTLLDSLGGSVSPERLLVESKLENNIDAFFELVRDACVDRLINAPIGEFGEISLH